MVLMQLSMRLWRKIHMRQFCFAEWRSPLLARGIETPALDTVFLKHYGVKGNNRKHPVRISFNASEAYDHRNDKGRGNEKRKED